MDSRGDSEWLRGPAGCTFAIHSARFAYVFDHFWWPGFFTLLQNIWNSSPVIPPTIRKGLLLTPGAQCTRKIYHLGIEHSFSLIQNRSPILFVPKSLDQVWFSLSVLFISSARHFFISYTPLFHPISVPCHTLKIFCYFSGIHLLSWTNYAFSSKETKRRSSEWVWVIFCFCVLKCCPKSRRSIWTDKKVCDNLGDAFDPIFIAL